MAENGAEALVALERTTYAGVLIDGSMPVMDGYETASRIRRAEAASGTVPLPTFLVTGDEDHVQRALDARMSGSIGKPVGARELLEQISRYASCVAIVESNTQL